MRTVKSIAVIALMLTAGATISLAQEKKEENHHVGEAGMGPHKGTIQEADPYHVEILIKEGKAHFYLLDEDAKPIKNKGVTGKAIFQFADKTSATVTLTAEGDDGFMANNDKTSSYTSCVATFTVNGKSVSAKFKAAKSVAKTYTCSMHPEVTSDKPGKCPKCGMDLVEKKEEHHHTEGDHKH
jgi:hypothetical protein